MRIAIIGVGEVGRCFAEPLQASGADPVEVIDDIKRHIDEELIHLKLAVVTADDLKRVLAKMGDPESAPHPAEQKTFDVGSLISA